MLARLKQYLRDRRGNFATMAAIMFPTLFATVALSVDITTQLDGRADLQNAADAAVLLAMRKMQLEGKVPDHATINDLLKINYPNKESPPTMSMSFDPSTGEMVLHAEAKVKLYMMSYFGSRSETISADAKATAGQGGILEFALALDTTGSMGGSKIVELKKAARSFVEIVFSAVDKGAEISGGVVPFSEYIRLDPKLRDEPWLDLSLLAKPEHWDGCMGSGNTAQYFKAKYQGYRFQGISSCRPAEKLISLTDKKATLVSGINSLNANGNTYIPDGIMWGTRILTHEAPFTDARDPATLDTPMKKALIVMTDGSNTIGRVGVYHSTSASGIANSNTLKACDEAKNNGIEVYTISFGSGVPTSVKNLLRACASDSANYYHAGNGGLDDVFSMIAGQLRDSVRLTQ